MIDLWCCYLSNRWRVWQWRRGLACYQRQFDKIYLNSNGFNLSKQNRLEYDALEYLYGEIDFESFIALLSLCRPNANTVFYDLGSGIGKAVIATAMVFSPKKSVGVELFANLTEEACKALNVLANNKVYFNITQKVQLIQSDFFKIDLHQATIIFINSTAFIGEYWQSLNQKLHQTRLKTLIITISKPLISKHFQIVHQTTVKMSWGIAAAFIHRKIIS